MKVEVEEFIRKMIEKGNQYQPIDERIIECHNHLIKSVEKSKQQYISLIGETGMRLGGDKRRLLSLLK